MIATVILGIVVLLAITIIRVYARGLCVTLKLLKEIYLCKKPYKILPEMEGFESKNNKEIWRQIKRDALIVDTFCGFSSMATEIVPTFKRMQSCIQILRNKKTGGLHKLPVFLFSKRKISGQFLDTEDSCGP